MAVGALHCATSDLGGCGFPLPCPRQGCWGVGVSCSALPTRCCFQLLGLNPRKRRGSGSAEVGQEVAASPPQPHDDQPTRSSLGLGRGLVGTEGLQPPVGTAPTPPHLERSKPDMLPSKLTGMQTLPLPIKSLKKSGVQQSSPCYRHQPCLPAWATLQGAGHGCPGAEGSCWWHPQLQPDCGYLASCPAACGATAGASLGKPALGASLAKELGKEDALKISRSQHTRTCEDLLLASRKAEPQASPLPTWPITDTGCLLQGPVQAGEGLDKPTSRRHGDLVARVPPVPG